MKKIIFTSIFFIFFITSNSQQLTNGNLSGNCTGNGFSIPSCIKGWSASHGTPTVLGNLENNTWALLSAYKNKSEGIFTNYNFIAGKTYYISLKMKTYSNIKEYDRKNNNITANIVATHKLVASSNEKKPIASSNSEIIWSKAITNGKENWEIIEIVFKPAKNNTQLWFFPSIKNNTKLNEEVKAQMEIDNIEIKTNENQEITINTNDDFIFPNPIHKGQTLRFLTNTKTINEIVLFNFTGEKQNINFNTDDDKTISFLIDDTIKKGIYTLNITRKDNTTSRKKIIIE